MSAEKKAEKLSEATEKTTAALQGLQSRLSRQHPRVAAPEETMEDLGRQLQEYFSTSVILPFRGPNEIREQVVQGVAEKIMRAWEEPHGQLSEAFKKELVDQLVERVLDRLVKSALTGPVHAAAARGTQ
jgi:hypothetical protein